MILFCSFCNGDTECKVDSAFGHYSVMCLACGASGPPATSAEKAISNWKGDRTWKRKQRGKD